MAVSASNPRRGGRPPGRPRIRSPNAPDSEPPNKRRKLTQGSRASNGRFSTSANREDTMDNATFPTSTEPEDFTINVTAPAKSEALVDETPMRAIESTGGRSVRPRTQPRSRGGYRERARTRGRAMAATRPRYSSAAAAAAATQANDGYKPREERSWEEFHPDLDIDADLMVFTADEVDGRAKTDPKPSSLRHDTSVTEEGGTMGTEVAAVAQEHKDTSTPQQVGTPMTNGTTVTPKRKPGRPPRRPESMLSGLGSPPAPRITPLPTHNPKERLNLPKPSFRHVKTFEHYERDKEVQINYVDKSMAHVGYQESELFEMPTENLIRHSEGPYDDDFGHGLVLESDEKPDNPAPPLVGNVEYDMDEQDEQWLEAHNAHRKRDEQVDAIRPAIFEITMTQIEREYYALEKRIPKPNPRHPNPTRPRSSSAAAVNGEPAGAFDEPDSKCAICDDGDCENANAIIFCDGCDLAVHQECYGVPFIPEGQWFCRKCKEIGRGTPTCIFCPNIDGAFKQTNTLRWSHLLCAIWIPEVSIANTTYMEPIQDVEKVPKGRWSLLCYICNQKMGACIQCGNKACYQAFHVTCARRARLFLKMKSSQSGGIDASVLKAFCDRHVPPDWRREHDVDNAIVDAKRYYRHTMRDRRWADSQSTALSIGAPPPSTHTMEMAEEIGTGDDNGTIVVTGRKKGQKAKTGWRLPSGAPVVPAAVFDTVEASLARFTIRKRKGFVAEACKYWTLKREARRGAALLKRLQLQLESFSSMEITRRNFVGMGAAGRPRLFRRIEFADIMTREMDRVAEILDVVNEREQKKLEDAENLRRLIDTLYFPMSDLLWPAFRKGKKLGEKSSEFANGFDLLEEKLSERYYTSVAVFCADLGLSLSDVIARAQSDVSQTNMHDGNDVPGHLDAFPQTISENQPPKMDQKELKKIAKRIVRAVKEPLQVALKKEAELKGTAYDATIERLADLDEYLDVAAIHSRRSSLLHSVQNGEIGNRTVSDVSATGGASPSPKGSPKDFEMADAQTSHQPHTIKESPIKIPTQPLSPPISASSGNQDSLPTVSDLSIAQLTSSAAKTAVLQDPWSQGGVPWYMASFDPVGTTVHEERRVIGRASSEALSEMDDDTLNELAKDQPEDEKVGVKSKKKQTPLPDKGRRTSARTRGNAAETADADGAGAEEAEEDEDDGNGETEKERIAREKREAYNAKRRAQRKANK